MIVPFIGSPASGKTTTAAMLFSRFKENGIPAEFIAEQARIYIARLRVAKGLTPTQGLTLTDEDQYLIMKQQLEAEELMLRACGSNLTIITDSSAINSLLYMSDGFRTSAEVKMLTDWALRHYKFSFITGPVPTRILGTDPNRVHDHEQSLAVDLKIDAILKEQAPTLQVKTLFGDISSRFNWAYVEILDRLMIC